MRFPSPRLRLHLFEQLAPATGAAKSRHALSRWLRSDVRPPEHERGPDGDLLASPRYSYESLMISSTFARY